MIHFNSLLTFEIFRLGTDTRQTDRSDFACRQKCLVVYTQIDWLTDRQTDIQTFSQSKRQTEDSPQMDRYNLPPQCIDAGQTLSLHQMALQFLKVQLAVGRGLS